MVGLGGTTTWDGWVHRMLSCKHSHIILITHDHINYSELLSTTINIYQLMLESNKIFEIVFCSSISLQEKLSPEGQEALTVVGRVRLRRERLRRARLRRARLRRERLLRRRRRRRRQPCDSEAVDSPRT